MFSDPVFGALSPNDLLEIAKAVNLNCSVTADKYVGLQSLNTDDQLLWLAENPGRVECEICRLGSWSFGETKTYRLVVFDLAEQFGVSCSAQEPTEGVERALIFKLWNDAVSKLSPEQAAQLKANARDAAEKLGASFGAELTSLAALTAAQMSGFGVYLMGSTLLGAVNGALGLGLGFGAFAGLSSIISTVIGPVGWAALGLFTVFKLGAPNYKKVLPAVIVVATARSLRSAQVAKLQDVSIESPIAVGSFAVTHKKPKANFQRIRRRDKRPKILAGPPAETDTSQTQVDMEFTTASEATASCAASTVTEKDTAALDGSKEDANYTAVSAKRRKPAEGKSQGRTVSRLDRLIFNQEPKNRAIRDIVAECTEKHFLDLSSEEQADVRKIAAERIKEATSLHSQREQLNRCGAQLSSSDTPAILRPRLKEANRARKKYKAIWPNLGFSDRAIKRLLDYEGSEIEQAFLADFRFLNEGHFSDKHHVPNTKPKLFQRDCGRSGRVYYRRDRNSTQSFVELVGDKNTQDRDYQLLQN